MSDIRRRRKQSAGSDDLSDSYDELNETKETQSTEQTEYDTDGTEEDDSEGGSQDGGERESGDGQEEDKPPKKLDDDEDRRNPQYIPKRGTFYEHDDRTAEESGETTAEPAPERETKEKKVWKDKDDRWNHDRYNDDEQAPKSHDELIAVYGYDIRNEEGPPRARRRRRYGRGPNKYTRNWEDEDAYGKTAGTVGVTGAAKNPGRRSNRSGEEFPALDGTEKEVSNESVNEPVISSAWYSNKNKIPMKQPQQQNFPPLQTQPENQKSKSGTSNSTFTSNENKAPNEPNNPAWKKEPKTIPTTTTTRNATSPNRNAAGGGGSDADKFINTQLSSPRETKDPRKRQVHESVSLAANRARGRGFKPGMNNNLIANRMHDTKPKGRGAGQISLDSRRINAINHRDDDLQLQQQQQQQIGNDIKHQTSNDGPYNSIGRQAKTFHAQSPLQQRLNVIPPRMQQQQQQPPMQTQQQQVHPPQQQQQLQQQQQQQQQQADVTGNRPKRYSTLRQRPAIPDGPTQPQQPPYPPQHPQHGFYPPQGFPQAHFEQAAPVVNSGAPMQGQPVIPLTPGGQPTGYAPPPFLVPPPQFISPQAAPPNIINYVPTPAGPPFQPNFQGYQGYNPSVQQQGPPPPPELFQPQGCTYYSPAQQHQQQAPMKRPKAAIPILPPPDTSGGQHYGQASRGRGRSIQNSHSGNVPENVMLSVGVSSQQQQQQQQEYEEPIVSVDSNENDNKSNNTETFDYERYEEAPTEASLSPPSPAKSPQPVHSETTTATTTTTTTETTSPPITTETISDIKETEEIVLPTKSVELIPETIPLSTESKEISEISPIEITEKKDEIIVESTKLEEAEITKIEPVTIDDKPEVVESTVDAIVASDVDLKTVELSVTIKEMKLIEAETNVAVEKSVAEETDA